MNLKAQTKPTIRKINKHLVVFERKSLYTTQECIKDRARFFRYSVRRPKRK